MGVGVVIQGGGHFKKEVDGMIPEVPVKSVSKLDGRDLPERTGQTPSQIGPSTPRGRQSQAGHLRPDSEPRRLRRPGVTRGLGPPAPGSPPTRSRAGPARLPALLSQRRSAPL
eukprot:764794-Hanusia_phi.AAC.5